MGNPKGVSFATLNEVSQTNNKLLKATRARANVADAWNQLATYLEPLDESNYESLHLFAAATHYMKTKNSIYLKTLNRNHLAALRKLEFWNHIKATSKLRTHRKTSSSKFTFADLFAGIGGFHLALASHGGQCLFASEWDTNAKITYAVNHGMVPFGDIRRFTKQNGKDRSLSQIRKVIPYVDVIAAGFPCQPFSLAGVSSRNHYHRSHGLDCETQGTSFHDIVLIAKALKPKALLLENVRNLKSHDSGRTIRVIRNEIEDSGYTIFPRDFESKDWAVIDSQSVSGQRRKRIYMVCIRNDIVRKNGLFEFPDFSFERPKLTLREVIAKDPMPQKQKFDIYGISIKLWKSHQRRDREHAKRSNGFRSNVMHDLGQPAPTLVARYFKDGKDCLIPDPKGVRPPRMLTPLECAILQTYPESFWIPTAKSVAYKQFGNSITVEVAQRIASCLAKYLEQ